MVAASFEYQIRGQKSFLKYFPLTYITTDILGLTTES